MNWTVGKVLEWTAGRFAKQGLPSARLDAELLLARCLGTDRIGLYLDFHKPLDDGERATYRELVRRRLAGEPVAYILGHKEFWSLDLDVDRRVLVPRPETELLVEVALDVLRGMDSPLVVDIGTGSGAIALALAKERPDAKVVATDLSADALQVAAANAEKLGLAVEFRHGNLFEPLADLDGEVDLLVSNPPYVAQDRIDQVEPAVLEYEPRSALLAGPDGLGVIRVLVEQAGPFLKTGGYLLLEMAFDQADAITSLFRSTTGWAEPQVRKDLAGKPRAVLARLGPVS